jgi:hypothetical protein
MASLEKWGVNIDFSSASRVLWGQTSKGVRVRTFVSAPSNARAVAFPVTVAMVS